MDQMGLLFLGVLYCVRFALGQTELNALTPQANQTAWGVGVITTLRL